MTEQRAKTVKALDELSEDQMLKVRIAAKVTRSRPKALSPRPRGRVLWEIVAPFPPWTPPRTGAKSNSATFALKRYHEAKEDLVQRRYKEFEDIGDLIRELSQEENEE